MKRTIISLCIATLILSVATAASATPVNDKVFGLGIEFGDPTAITGKFMPTDKFGIQFFVGGGNWWWWDRMFMTGVDFVWHPTMIYDGWRTCALNWTIGVGPAVGVFHGDRRWYDGEYYDDKAYATFIVRMVTGLNLWFKKFPLETFFELTPSLHFFHPEDVGFHFMWVVAGARWYF